MHLNRHLPIKSLATPNTTYFAFVKYLQRKHKNTLFEEDTQNIPSVSINTLNPLLKFNF